MALSSPSLSSSRHSVVIPNCLLLDDEEPIFLKESYSKELLCRYYDELLVPLIPFEDERDSLEKLVHGLKTPSEKLHSETNQPYVNICLIVSKQKLEGEGEDAKVILYGAVQFEYYCTANCGLMNYLLVNENYRGRGVAKKLVSFAQTKLEMIAKYYGHLAGCNAVFVETNSATKVDASDDTIPPLIRHQIFTKMGMRLLDFDYVQAPLTEDKSKVNYLLLLVFLSPRTPTDFEDSYYLPSSLVRNAIKAFWRASPVAFNKDVDFLRMDDQLKRRNRVMLLDLPWDRPFTLVDMHENVDLELMVTFYEMLIDVYGRENLVVLDEWLNTLCEHQSGSKKQVRNDDVEPHVLLSLQYSEHEREHAKPIVGGGLSFFYFPTVNCGLITHPLFPSETQGGARMASSLFEWAITEIDVAARGRGHLAGANAIFLEAVGEAPASSGKPKRSDRVFMSGAALHVLFEQLGWRLVDFDFVPPPQVTEFGEITYTNRLLLVRVTSNIPRFTQITEGGVEEFSYLNQSTVVNFVRNYWKSFQDNCSDADYPIEGKEEEERSWRKMYQRMEEQLERCERIPLRPRPWRRSYMLVDLHEDPDPELLEEFKKKLLDPIKLVSQADFDQWVRLLPREGERNATRKNLLSSSFDDTNPGVENDFHILLALDRGQNLGPNQNGSELILAAMVFEYNVRTNCGFVLHFVTFSFATRDNPKHPEDVGGPMFSQAMSILEQNAVARGHLSGCNCIFMETLREEVPSKLTSSPEPYRIVDFRGRHDWLYSFGCRLLDVDYLPPPRTPGITPQPGKMKQKQLFSLAVVLTPRIPRYPTVMNYETTHYLPQELVQNFLVSYWEHCCSKLNLRPEKFLLYRRMIDLVERRRIIPLMDLPWSREWTLVDLYESSDVALLYSFYHSNLWTKSISDKRESLASWVSMLEDKKKQQLVNLHIILALQYPNNSSGTRPTVGGGVVSKYFSQINCALVTHLLCSGNEKQKKVMAFSLLEELAENTELNAIEGGHIAGCNSIFFELDSSLSSLIPQAKNRASAIARSPGAEKKQKPASGSGVIDSALVDGGWWLVDLDYYQPPLTLDISSSELKGSRMSLLVLLTPKLPRDENQVPYLTGDTIRSFINLHWQHACERVGKSLEFDEDFQSMMGALNRKKVPLIQLGVQKKKGEQ